MLQTLSSSSSPCFQLPKMSEVDLEQGVTSHHRRRLSSLARSDVSDADDEEEGSVSFSDASSCYSQFFSTNEQQTAVDVGVMTSSRRVSSVSERSCCSVAHVDVEIDESNAAENKAGLERDCRICHLGLESNSHESGAPISLGCSCKDDLGSAHRNCADAWFKIKGNKICEICHSIARNIVGPNDIEMIEQLNIEAATASASAAVSAPAPSTETRSFWHGHRFLNFLLACMVFAFVISWLFHFNVPS